MRAAVVLTFVSLTRISGAVQAAAMPTEAAGPVAHTASGDVRGELLSSGTVVAFRGVCVALSCLTYFRIQ